jgi:hypothetical protein
MWVLHLRLGLHLRLLKSPMGYFKTNLDMAIAFKAKYLYNLAIPAHILFSPTRDLALNFLMIK